MTSPPMARAGEIWVTLQPGLRELLPLIVTLPLPHGALRPACGVWGGAVTMAARVPWPPAGQPHRAQEQGRALQKACHFPPSTQGPGWDPPTEPGRTSRVPQTLPPGWRNLNRARRLKGRWPSMGTAVLEGGE